MKIVYMAHPVRGDVSGNLAAARRWVKWIEDNNHDIAVVANWIIECEIYDDGNVEERARGIERNLAVIERCDEVWLVGERISEGMAAELDFAKSRGIRTVEYIGQRTPPCDYGDNW